MKKLLVSIMMLTLVFSVSCTSKKDTDMDQETAEATDPAQDLEGAAAAESMDDMETSTDDFAEDEEVVADTGDEALPDETLAPEASGAEGEEVSLTDDASSTSADVVSEDVAGTSTDDGSITSDVSDTTVSSDESVFDTSTSSDSSGESTALLDTPTPKPNIPLQKIKDAPYTQSGVLLNTVYIGRPGDTVSSVSMKVFGADRSADLKAANSFLKRREVKVGDKIYYNSPKRPQDGERMLTYYEDNGIPAQSYVSKAGDNIRTVSATLLGDKDSWKEVWATNLAVESKGDLPEGTELRYWMDSGNSIPIADNSAPAQEAVEPSQPVAQDTANTLPADDFAMPDDMSGSAAGSVAVEPPPPPPPPPPAATKQVASSNDKDMTFMLSAGGLLLVGVGIILAVMRRSRSRKMSMNTNTQI